MNTNRELFEEAPVPKAVALMAVPTMISMLVVVIYNMADTFFIGQTGDPLQVAAVSLRRYRPGHNSCGALYSRNGFDSEADRSQREYN